MCPRPHHVLNSLQPSAPDVLRSLSALIILPLVIPNTIGTSQSPVGNFQLMSAEGLGLRQGQAGSGDSSQPWRGCTSRRSRDARDVTH